MTGFGRARGEALGLAWSWEVRSVNGKGLDVRLRLPPGWDGVEAAAREVLSKRLARGNVTATLTLAEQAEAGAPAVTVNTALLHQLMELARDLPFHVSPPNFDGLLALRGVLTVAEPSEPTDEERAARERAALATLAEAAEALSLARRDEGVRIGAVLAGHLATVEDLVARSGALAQARAGAAGDRLRAQVAELLGAGAPVSEDRLAQELALLAVKQDVREEIDRLTAHIAQARDLLSGRHGACGRRLDFLCQEFNREANTLCSKSQDNELTRLGLDLKAVIDQLREQVQNIE